MVCKLLRDTKLKEAAKQQIYQGAPTKPRNLPHRLQMLSESILNFRIDGGPRVADINDTVSRSLPIN